MGKFDGILICTDLDGTLIKSDESISDEVKEKIAYFMSEGGYFTIMTGRSPQTARKIADAIKINCPYGCTNGGGLYDHYDEKYVRVTHLAQGYKEIVKYAEKHIDGIGYQVTTEDSMFFCCENEAMERYRQRTGAKHIKGCLDDVENGAVKVVFGDVDRDRMDRVENMVKSCPGAEKFDFVRTEETLFEILPKDVNKGKALKMLCEYLNIDIRKTVAVGDYTNDVEMIKAAGVGIAVENANEDAKAASDYITVSNDEDAIARVIEDIESGKISFGERK